MTYIYIIIAIAAIAATISTLLVLWLRKRRKASAKECALEVQAFQEKLKRLSDPSHFFSDEELFQLKQEYGPLLDRVYGLYDSMFVSREYLDSIGLRGFLREWRFLNHTQLKNNQLHK